MQNKFNRRQSIKAVCYLCVWSSLSVAFLSRATAADFTAEESVISSLSKKYAPSLLLERQYEVDLQNGVLWSFLCKVDSSNGNFVITYGALEKEAIVDLEKDQNLPEVMPQRGFARIDGKYYMANMLTGEWKPSESEWVLSEFDRLDFFDVKNCFDLQREIESLDGTIKESGTFGLDQIDQAKRVLAELTADNGGLRSYQQGPWDIKFDSMPNGFIDSWEIYRDGLLVRKVINEILPRQVLSVDSLSRLFTPKPVLQMGESLKGLGNTPSIGAFIAKKQGGGGYFAGYVLDGGPAFLAGVRSGDPVLKINGVDIAKMEIPDLKVLIQSDVTKMSITYKNQDDKVVTEVIQKEVLKWPDHSGGTPQN